METRAEPYAVNKFVREHEAVDAAKRWSMARSEQWSVIHAPASGGGLAYFVERGDGGMIRSNETLIATFVGGKRT